MCFSIAVLLYQGVHTSLVLGFSRPEKEGHGHPATLAVTATKGKHLALWGQAMWNDMDMWGW